jgi:hypothetical protein
MNFKKKLKYTKFLFFISISFSIISYSLSLKGIPEIYPFFYWKLYSQPLGSNEVFNDYRLYGITKDNDTLRIPNIGYPHFNKDDYYYFITNEASKIKSNSFELNYHKSRIQVFGEFIAPNFENYILAQEQFKPITLLNNTKNYNISILLSTK